MLKVGSVGSRSWQDPTCKVGQLDSQGVKHFIDLTEKLLRITVPRRSQHRVEQAQAKEYRGQEEHSAAQDLRRAAQADFRVLEHRYLHT